MASLTRQQVANFNLSKSDDLCKLVEQLGYKGHRTKIVCKNKASIASLMIFLDKNPDAMEKIKQYILYSENNLINENLEDPEPEDFEDDWDDEEETDDDSYDYEEEDDWDDDDFDDEE